jgi:hypothetical protein
MKNYPLFQHCSNIRYYSNPRRQYSLDLTPETANVPSIRGKLEETHGLADPVVLDAHFQKISHHRSTSGELFWNWRTKYHVANKAEWETLFEKRPKSPRPELSYRKVIHPIQQSPRLPSSNGVQEFPITQPRTYRRAFTRLRIESDKVFTFKDVINISFFFLAFLFVTNFLKLYTKKNYRFKLPLDLTEYVSNVNSIRLLLAHKFGLNDPIVLDKRYLEVNDKPNVRGKK